MSRTNRAPAAENATPSKTKTQPELLPVARPIALPEVRSLREVRKALSFGGLTPKERRTPEDHARITSFRVLEDLLQFLDEYRRRIEAGEKLGLVEVEHGRTKGRLILEFEVQP